MRKFLLTAVTAGIATLALAAPRRWRRWRRGRLCIQLTDQVRAGTMSIDQARALLGLDPRNLP